MEPTDALFNVVEASLALAGFAGIVTALGIGSSGHWRLDDRERIVHLMLGTLVPFVAALVALVLVYADVASVWRLSSACYALLVLGGAVVGARSIWRAREDPEFSTNPLYAATLFALSAVSLTLQVLNLVSVDAFGPFFAGLAISLGMGASQFARLLWFVVNRPPAA